jgi:hypothetical protein
MKLDDRFRVNGSGVTHEVVDDEAVIINLETGSYYSLELVGAEIWSMLTAHLSLGAIVEHLARRYAGDRSEMELAVHGLVGELHRERLIVAAEDGIAAPPLSPGPAPAEGLRPFRVPVLQKFTDMQELLLLDPIHEVDERGWPHRKLNGQP